jgi:hypothetical protein
MERETETFGIRQPWGWENEQQYEMVSYNNVSYQQVDLVHHHYFIIFIIFIRSLPVTCNERQSHEVDKAEKEAGSLNKSPSILSFPVCMISLSLFSSTPIKASIHVYDLSYIYKLRVWQ